MPEKMIRELYSKRVPRTIANMESPDQDLTFKVAKYAGTDKCDLIESSEYGFGCLLQTADRIIDRLHVENRTWTRITST